MGVFGAAAKHLPVSTSATLFSYASPRSLPALPTLAQLREHADNAAAALPTMAQLTGSQAGPAPVKKDKSFSVSEPREIPAAGRSPPPRYAMRDPSYYAFTLGSVANEKALPARDKAQTGVLKRFVRRKRAADEQDLQFVDL